MKRLLICVEGETEESFVDRLLGPYLIDKGYSLVFPHLMGVRRERSRRGGIRRWSSVRQEILNHLREDPERYVSTMVDYYGMPNDWPGRASPFTAAMSASDRADEIEAALLRDVSNEMGTDFNPDRFIPYVMMREFEALLFSNCDSFARAIGRSDLIDDFQAIRDDFTTPEEIDDSPDTAPSKRIEALHPAYQKPTMGVLAAQSISLEAIRSECPHFADWLERLASLL